jgi:hypothetical protein
MMKEYVNEFYAKINNFVNLRFNLRENIKDL